MHPELVGAMTHGVTSTLVIATEGAPNHFDFRKLLLDSKSITRTQLAAALIRLGPTVLKLLVQVERQRAFARIPSVVVTVAPMVFRADPSVQCF